MTNKTNVFEGQTSGTAWTAAGSGGGSWDALDSLITAGSGATGLYDSAQKMHGSQSLAVSGPSGSQWIATWTLSGGSWSVRIYLRITSFTSAQDIAQVRNSGGQASTIGLSSGRAVQVKNAAGTSIETLATLALDTWYRIDWWGNKGTTTSNGTTLVAIYTGDGTTAVSSSTTGTANQNTGTSDYTQLRIGKLTSASAISCWIDSISVRDDAAGDLGPFLRSGAGMSSLTLASDGAGKKTAAGSGSSSLTISSTGVGAKTGAGSGTSGLTITGTGQGSKRAIGSGASTLVVTGGGSGTKGARGSGACGLTVSGAGGGWKRTAGSGVCTLTVTGNGAGFAEAPDIRFGSGTATLTLTGSGQGVKRAAGAGASALAVGAAGSGTKAVAGSGMALLTVTASGQGQATRPPPVTLTLGASAWRPVPLAVQAAAWTEPDLTIGDVTWE